jgi:hypothetical protein
MENIDADHVKMLKNACVANAVEFKEILTEEILNIEIEAAAMKTTGLFLLNKQFGRGVDFKLKCTAKVLVFMNGELKF